MRKITNCNSLKGRALPPTPQHILLTTLFMVYILLDRLLSYCDHARVSAYYFEDIEVLEIFELEDSVWNH